MTEALRARGNVVDALSSALDQGGHGIHNAPTLLRRVLAEGSWREFETRRGEIVRHDTFPRFVTTPPLKDLGTTLTLVRRIVLDDPAAVDLLDQVVAGRQGERTDLLDNIQEVERPAAPSGTSREAALRRLRKDRSDLHARVLVGELSPHAAMVEAGFRRRTVTTPVDKPEATARSLRHAYPLRHSPKS